MNDQTLLFANAYGSVRHNLIQFALNWYHIPLFIQELISGYYKKLCAMVITKEWTAGFSCSILDFFKGVCFPTSYLIVFFNY